MTESECVARIDEDASTIDFQGQQKLGYLMQSIVIKTLLWYPNSNHQKGASSYG
jgi:hypothetical protein